MTRPIAFVTGNAGKFGEVAALIPNLVQLKLELEELQGLDPRPIIEHKLNQAAQQHPGPLMVEDTSLGFDCLGGLPGVLIKWFEHSMDNAALANLVHRYDDHSATARCTIGYRDEQGNIAYFTGEVQGTIVPPRGTLNPYGWNNIFQPHGYSTTFAEMTIEAKNAVSMRGQAARRLADHLAGTR